MISRREVVTAGVLGTLAGGTAIPADAAEQDRDYSAELSRIQNEINNLRSTLDRALIGPSLSTGYIADIREKFTTHLRSTGKFPDLMEIGTNVFYDVYDWHIRHQQQIQIVRISEQRFAIQFMFTQLVVRWEQDPKYLGPPYDRG